jgi:hypothetical protein
MVIEFEPLSETWGGVVSTTVTVREFVVALPEEFVAT